MAGADRPERSAGVAQRVSTPVSGTVLGALVTYRAFRFLWLSSVLTQIAQWMLQVATAWLMLQLTDSVFWVGLLGFAGGIPFLFVAVPAGTLSERLDQRAILLACQGSALALSVVLATLVLAHWVSPWLLIGATLINGALLAANNATRQAMLPSCVPRQALQNAVGLLSAGMNMTRIVGPSLAGPLVGTLGVGGTLLLQAMCLALALVNTVQLPPSPPAGRITQSFLEGLTAGLRYVRQTSVVFALLVLASVPTILVFPYLHLLPVFARDVLQLGPSGLGLLYAIGGSGALTGSLFVASFRGMRRRGAVMVTMIVVYGLVVSLFTLVHWLPVVSICLFLAGFLGASYMALNNALLHLAVDDEVRGRVMGLYMVTWAFMPLGALPLGALGDLIGIDRAVLLGAMASSTVCLLVAWRVPALLRLS